MVLNSITSIIKHISQYSTVNTHISIIIDVSGSKHQFEIQPKSLSLQSNWSYALERYKQALLYLQRGTQRQPSIRTKDPALNYQHVHKLWTVVLLVITTLLLLVGWCLQDKNLWPLVSTLVSQYQFWVHRYQRLISSINTNRTLSTFTSHYQYYSLSINIRFLIQHCSLKINDRLTGPGLQGQVPRLKGHIKGF